MGNLSGPDASSGHKRLAVQARNTWAAVTGLCLAARDAGAAVGVATHDKVATHALVSPGGRALTLDRGRLT